MTCFFYVRSRADFALLSTTRGAVDEPHSSQPVSIHSLPPHHETPCPTKNSINTATRTTLNTASSGLLIACWSVQYRTWDKECMILEKAKKKHIALLNQGVGEIAQRIPGLPKHAVHLYSSSTAAADRGVPSQGFSPVLAVTVVHECL